MLSIAARVHFECSRGTKRFLVRCSSSSSTFRFYGERTPGSGPLAQEKPATLILQDGTEFAGYSFGYEGEGHGELVFNTGMTGYPENLTDPSYRGQFLVSTYPLVGNYGVPSTSKVDQFGLPENLESDGIHVSGLIVQRYDQHYAHWNAEESLGSWLAREKVPAIHGVDTRALTKKIRDSGAMLGRIEVHGGETSGEGVFHDPNTRNLIAEVSTPEVRVFGEGNPIRIVAVDCGIKYNMIRHMVSRGCELRLVPWDHDILNESYDGLFVSNGPGDPSMAGKTVENLRALLDGKGASPEAPIFGICMGNQLLGTAAGASTYKMKFGNRGQNVPVLNELTGRCVITPQNHGYAVDVSTLQPGWKPLYTNKNDGTNEGIYHETRPFFSAQFHPEARGGPTDTADLFDLFVDMAKGSASSVGAHFKLNKLPRPDVSKVLLLGSGGLSIGQAGEFDYSGSQALKALKEEGLETILMNPNIASVQTNLEGEHQADVVYFMPVTPDFVEKIIEKEKPDGIILSMGGQTALNCGVELYESGVLQKHGVQVLGTQIEAIMDTEDRDRFSKKIGEIGERIAESIAVDDLDAAVAAAEKIGFPVMIRSAFALGGLGSGICHDEAELREMGAKALASAPQILVERSMLGWKELEYEVVRDVADNCITVCNMENFDPLGVHTGDSIVIAPSQTLSNDEYHMLRETALRTVRHMGIVGECNIQYALDPHSMDYCIIEINPRLSRSSALASKATGYPLAFVAAKLALGIELPDLRNSVTQTTTACFEPSLDYVVTKVPRWDLSKFDKVSRRIGSAMKSVGEVMAIGRTFEESLQKALRMVDPSVEGFEDHGIDLPTSEELEQALAVPSDIRIRALALAIKRGMTVEEIYDHTKIDPWFLYKLDGIHEVGEELQRSPDLHPRLLRTAKKFGFSDRQIASRRFGTEDEVREARKSHGIVPYVKQIDTTAAETPAATNYLYTTYNGTEHDVEFKSSPTMVLGSGAYRIGSSVEFDWCSVSAIRTLRGMGKDTVVVNCNPETVSTDYDECDKLYFEELSRERVLDIYEAETCADVIVSVGGQIPNSLALKLDGAGVNIVGTPPKMIDNAEDRNKFSALCDANGIDQPRWRNLTSTEDAFEFSREVGYPVLVRPSYVLSGAAMNVAYSEEELAEHLQAATEVSPDYPVVITEFIENGREIDVDAVADNGEVLVHAISEHVENAGVHSGDATLMLPPQGLAENEMDLVRETTGKIAKALNITGPFNMQLIAKDGAVKIIETNVRASRSFPFSSKTTGVDFIDVATRAMVGAPQPNEIRSDLRLGGDSAKPYPSSYVGVKAPMFSFKRLTGADPTLGVEMASTGEVACYGESKEEAFLKAMLSTNFPLPERSILVSMQDTVQANFLPSVRKFESLGYKIYATERTARFLENSGVQVTELHWPESGKSPSLTEFVREGGIDLVLMFANNLSQRLKTNYDVRRLAVDFGVPLITNVQVAQLFADSIEAMRKTSNGEPSEFCKTATLREYYDIEAKASAK